MKRVEEPLVREVAQSFYLMGLLGGVVGAYLGLGLFLVAALG